MEFRLNIVPIEELQDFVDTWMDNWDKPWWDRFKLPEIIMIAYNPETGNWVSADNESGHCNVEECKSLHKLLAWFRGECDQCDLYI